jgi:hypothetical protein
MKTDISFLDMLTFTLATIGSLLGIANGWWSLARDRVRLKVTPVRIYEETDAFKIGIEIVNLSYFPITVEQVGFHLAGTDLRIQLTNHDMQRSPVGMRMEPRTRHLCLVMPHVTDHEKFNLTEAAYVKTSCGEEFTGNSKALRNFIKSL